MKRLSQSMVRGWVTLGPRFLPFADVASADLPLSRLLRLSLFQVSVGMALVLMMGTLNRVMIVELGVAPSLVALMVALPVLYAPFRALVGFRSDHHRAALGWRRVPFIWRGTMIQFGGLAIMPWALLVLSGGGNAQAWPHWMGPAAACVAFLLVGIGLHTTQTAGLALATDLVPERDQPKMVGLMYVMLLAGSIVSALVFGWALADYSPARLVQVIQASAVATLVLNGLSLWKQDGRDRARGQRPAPDVGFAQALQHFVADAAARRRLWIIGLGTMAFTMQDVLLEPYGGAVLGMTVGQTTWLTATLAAGGLLGFTAASVVLARGADAMGMALRGAWLGVPAFVAVIVAAPLDSVLLFSLGVFGIGSAGGLFSHGTLTSTMQ
ncbi:MAG: MFS transporter, partial [Betaproteobacteria bacterium]